MIDQKRLENVEYFNYSGSIITKDARRTCETESRIAMAKAALNKKKAFSTSKLDFNLRKQLVNCQIGNIALYGAGTWALRQVDQKHLESFEMWSWTMMERIIWADRVKKKIKILHTVR
jgi:precorrin-4 methylase